MAAGPSTRKLQPIAARRRRRARHPRLLDLPGPSRRIVVEPLEVPGSEPSVDPLGPLVDPGPERVPESPGAPEPAEAPPAPAEPAPSEDPAPAEPARAEPERAAR